MPRFMKHGHKFYSMLRLNYIEKEYEKLVFTFEKKMIVADLKGVGISLVDFTPREVAYISFSNIQAKIQKVV